MWDRFTKRTRQLLKLAQEEAAARGQREIGPEHLLLGITRDETSVAFRVLTKSGLSPDELRTDLERTAAAGLPMDQCELQLSPAAHQVMHRAYEEARAGGNHYIGTEHVLLGLLAEESGIAAQSLREAGAAPEQMRLILAQMAHGVI